VERALTRDGGEEDGQQLPRLLSDAHGARHQVVHHQPDGDGDNRGAPLDALLGRGSSHEGGVGGGAHHHPLCTRAHAAGRLGRAKRQRHGPQSAQRLGIGVAPARDPGGGVWGQ
jgi:hypothetical protein